MDLRYEKIRSYIVQRPSVKAGGFLYRFSRYQRHNGHFQKSIYIIFERSAGDKAEWSAENRASLPAKYFMDFFNSAVEVLQTLVVALGGGLCVWGGINLLEGYGNDNPGAKSQGVKQLVAGGGVALIGVTLIPLLSGLLG